jgi:RimJ/RimL family protein N-acetyltransferase
LQRASGIRNRLLDEQDATRPRLYVEALDTFVRWIFWCLGAQRIEWQGIVINPTSWTVAAKVGFQLEGALRARAPQRGVARDTEIAGLLPDGIGLPADTVLG